MRKKTKEDYYNLVKDRNIFWDAAELPKSTQTKTWWKCKKCGYRWQAKYSKIQQKHGCPKCSNRIKKTEQDYYDIVKDRDILWIGDELPSTTKIKTLWKCIVCGHTWESTYGNIRLSKSGKCRGCPVCANNIKKTKQDYSNLAKTVGYSWVGAKLPLNNKTKTRWLCNKGHKFEMIYNSLYLGNRCPICSNRLPKIKKDYYNLAEKYNFCWDSKDLPKTTHYKTWWRCKKNNHRFEASYNNIQAGWGCPQCSDMINGSLVSKPQRKLNKLLHGSLNYPEAKYRIDVAIMRNSQKIAVEYDCQYWHQGNEEHDKKRDLYLLSKGWKVLHVKSGNLLPTRKQLKKAIKELLNKKDIVNIYLKDWKI